MTAERSSDPGRQRTVAELLQQYGGDGRSGGGGRRRRRSADAEDDAAVESTGSGLPADPPSPASPHASETLSNYPSPSFGQPSGAGEGGLDWLGGGRSEWDRSPGVEDSYSALDRTGRVSDSYLTPDRPAGEDSFEWDREAPPEPLGGRDAPLSGGTGGTGGFPTQAYRGIYQGDSRQSGAFRAEPYQPESYQPESYQPEPYQPEPYQPEPGPAETTQAYRADPLAPPKRPERPTDRLPRYRSAEDEGPSTEVASRAALLDEDELEDTQGDGRLDEDDDEVESFRVPLGPEDTGQGLRRVRDDRDDDLDDDPEADDEPDEPEQAPSGRRSRRARAADAEAPAGLEDEDELDDPEDGRSALVAWLILVGQGIAGAVLGGALWIGFRYLWLNFPVIALAGAVLATAGLVLVVRTIRGSDDIRTTMLAVLVGLIVTISPAVLLLTANG